MLSAANLSTSSPNKNWWNVLKNKDTAFSRRKIIVMRFSAITRLFSTIRPKYLCSIMLDLLIRTSIIYKKQSTSIELCFNKNLKTMLLSITSPHFSTQEETPKLHRASSSKSLPQTLKTFKLTQTMAKDS